MRSHDIVNGLKIKYMAQEAGLSIHEMEIILTVRFSGSMVTPTLNRLLGIRRSEMNKRTGPRLEEKGWLRHEPSTHRLRAVVPSKRWFVPEEKLEVLRQLEIKAQETLNSTMTSSFTKDLDWIPEEAVACSE